MVRWVFVLLVMANIFYAFWHWQGGANTPVTLESGGESGVPTLVRLEELGAERIGQLAAREAPAEEPEVADSLESACWYVGRFDDRKRADSAVTVAQQMQLKVHLETTQVPEEPDYWVHVGPFSTRERAMSVLQQLRARRIDSFLIDEGELKNAISLGFFSQKGSADRLLAQHRDLGYPVKVFEVERFRPRYELFVSGRVLAEDIRQAMAAERLSVSPTETAKKSCI